MPRRRTPLADIRLTYAYVDVSLCSEVFIDGIDVADATITVCALRW